MATGKVKWYNNDKSFGFIIPDDGGGDVFLHKTSLDAAGIRTLTDGQPIQYDLEKDKTNGKTKAENLVLL